MYVLNDINNPERTSTSRGSTILMSQCCRINDDSKSCYGNNWTIFNRCLSNVPTSFLVLIVQTSGVATPMVWVYLLFLCYFFLLSFLRRMYWNSLLLIPSMGRMTTFDDCLRWWPTHTMYGMGVPGVSTPFFLWFPFGISINFPHLVWWELNNLVEGSVPDFDDPEFDLQLFFLSFSCMSCELLPYWGK